MFSFTAKFDIHNWWQRGVLGAIILLSTLLAFAYIGYEPFQDYDEATYAYVIDQTLRSDDILTLKHSDNPWYEKPPLVLWSAMLSGTVISQPEVAYRIPAALAAVGSVILAILIVGSITEMFIPAALAGFAMATTPAYIEAARQLRLDVPVTFFTLLAIYFFIRGIRHSRMRLFISPAIALAIMTKSVIGLFAGAFFFWWMCIYRDISPLKDRNTWIGALLGLLILAPWHLYETMQYGSAFWHDYLWYHVLHRFGANILGSAVSNWTYLNYFAQASLPWSVVLVLSLPLLFRIRKVVDIRMVIVTVLTLVSTVGVFFTAKTKIIYYLTPVYPYIAICIGLIAALGARYIQTTRARIAVLSISVLFACGAIINTLYITLHYSPMFQVIHAIAAEEHHVGVIAKNDFPELKLYNYQYEYLETLRYYSGGRAFEPLREDTILTEPFLLVVHRVFYDKQPFPPELASHFSIVYKGPITVLLKFTP